MITTADVLESWRASSLGATNDVCLDTSHPLGAFATLEDGRESFLLIADQDPRSFIRLNSHAVEVSCRRRMEDLQWACSLTLTNPLLDLAFAELVAAIVNNSADASSTLDSLILVGQTIDEMGLLFRVPQKPGLTLAQLRGLFAEMWLISRFASISFGPNAAVDGWRGPLGSPHDFDFGHSHYLEVKSRHVNHSRIRISSEKQLFSEAGRLFLAVFAFDDLPPSEEVRDGWSLVDVIREVEEHPATTAATVSVLRGRLALLGVSLDDPRLRETRFTEPAAAMFEVGPSFPRIIPSMVPRGVSEVTYTIALPELSGFETDWPGDHSGA